MIDETVFLSLTKKSRKLRGLIGKSFKKTSLNSD